MQPHRRAAALPAAAAGAPTTAVAEQLLQNTEQRGVLDLGGAGSGTAEHRFANALKLCVAAHRRDVAQRPLARCAQQLERELSARSAL